MNSVGELDSSFCNYSAFSGPCRQRGITADFRAAAAVEHVFQRLQVLLRATGSTNCAHGTLSQPDAGSAVHARTHAPSLRPHRTPSVDP